MKKLPDKWYIIWKNKDNFNIINEYFDYVYIYDSDAMHSKAGCSPDGYIPATYNPYLKTHTEITFEQFCKFVLKTTCKS